MERLYGTTVGLRVHRHGPLDDAGLGVRPAAGLFAHPVRRGPRRHFFQSFGRLHPRKNFPHVSVLVIGLMAMICSFFNLGMVIDALVTSRILIQFLGQIGAVFLLSGTGRR